MSRFTNAFETLAPDFKETVGRFPLTIILLAVLSAVFVGGINDWSFRGDEQTWLRWCGGLASAALVATAGYYFAESRPKNRLIGGVLIYLLPAIVAGLFQVRSVHWVVVPLLPVMSLLWLSVAPFTVIGKGAARAEQQDKFWWLNHRAVTSAVIAFLAMLIIGLGLVAIERSLDLLFGMATDELIYKFALPLLSSFFAPVYWLSTLPRVAAFEPETLSEPDFLSRAIGFLGQFILTPLLLAYALILFAYAAQIAMFGFLPDGVLGWMVLAFTVVGTVNILLLHPSFMSERLLVRLFRRSWFWVTLLPLALYALAVGIRVDAYGLTPLRVLLIGGGVWGTVLAVLFIFPRTADIRLIPALAGLVFLVGGIGPSNIENVSILNQAGRLKAVLEAAGFDGPDAVPVWTDEGARVAQGAVRHLDRRGDKGETLSVILQSIGVEYDAATTGYTEILRSLGAVTESPDDPSTISRVNFGRMFLSRNPEQEPVSVAVAPMYLGALRLFAREQDMERVELVQYGLSFGLTGNVLSFYDLDAATLDDPIAQTDLSDWVNKQERDQPINEPFVDFTVEGTLYRFVLNDISLRARADADGAEPALFEIENMRGHLFRNDDQDLGS